VGQAFQPAGLIFSIRSCAQSAAPGLERHPGRQECLPHERGKRMSRSLTTDAVEQYVYRHNRETPVQQRLRAETAKLPESNMQIGPDQAAFLALLVRASGARRTLEIGTFTGTSALAVASALPSDGKLIACDWSDAWTAVARRYWQEAGVAERIELRLGPALATLSALEGEKQVFDFAFIDADKREYDAYYESCLRLVRPGGLIAIDNALWSGSVADATVDDDDTAAIRALNAKIRDDDRVDCALLTVGDGVMLARRR
jgi:predicted O-methyltransferase YrrM